MNDVVMISIVRIQSGDKNNNILKRINIDNKEYAIIKHNYDDNTNNIIYTFKNNPCFIILPMHTNNNIIDFPFDLCLNHYQREQIKLCYKIGLYIVSFTKTISNTELYELLAEKNQYYEYMKALGLMYNAEKIRYSNEKQYIGKHVEFPFIESPEGFNLNDLNGEIAFTLRNLNGANTISATLIGSKVTSISGSNKYDTDEINAFCLEVYEAISTLTQLLKSKKRTDGKLVNDIYKLLHAHNIELSDTNKILFKFVMTSLMYNIKAKLLSMLSRYVNVAPFERELLMDCITYYKTIYKKEHKLENIKYMEKYIKINIALNDGKYYHKPSVINIEPYYFPNNIDDVVSKYKNYYID